MSKQELVVLGQSDENGACCPGLVTAPLDEGQAAELAKLFKALGDPVRLRLLSLIASRAGGEVCVCDRATRRNPVTAGQRRTLPTVTR